MAIPIITGAGNDNITGGAAALTRITGGGGHRLPSRAAAARTTSSASGSSVPRAPPSPGIAHITDFVSVGRTPARRFGHADRGISEAGRSRTFAAGQIAANASFVANPTENVYAAGDTADGGVVVVFVDTNGDHVADDAIFPAGLTLTVLSTAGDIIWTHPVRTDECAAASSGRPFAFGPSLRRR